MLLCLRNDVVILGHVNRFTYLLTLSAVQRHVVDVTDCFQAASRLRAFLAMF